MKKSYHVIKIIKNSSFIILVSLTDHLGDSRESRPRKNETGTATVLGKNLEQ